MASPLASLGNMNRRLLGAFHRVLLLMLALLPGSIPYTADGSLLANSRQAAYSPAGMCCADPHQETKLPEKIEEFLDDGVAKCIAFNQRGTLLAGRTTSCIYLTV